ncbi:hypothetical protein LZ32DRAFT_604419 [Colletotrichum eremochloae]|nr:hypothetical protein LZ32DRAFT_604419 [Colletotrichum eremochloae]
MRSRSRGSVVARSHTLLSIQLCYSSGPTGNGRPSGDWTRALKTRAMSRLSSLSHRASVSHEMLLAGVPFRIQCHLSSLTRKLRSAFPQYPTQNLGGSGFG